METPLIALTMGDPSGIGPEIIIKTVLSQEACKKARLAVIGYPAPFHRDIERLDLDVKINVIGSPGEASGEAGVLDLVVPEAPVDIGEGGEGGDGYGVIGASSGLAAARCIELSARFALAGEVDAVVTAPITKESLNLAGFDYPGHTEFYQALTGAPDIAMLLTLGDFRIIHVVTHTAIRDVPRLVTRERIVRVVTLMHEALVLLGIDRPRLAVSGLNPHAGEAGLFGSEEIEQIAPAVGDLRVAGMDISGPYPPDTVFARAYCGEFDGVVAMFHDQGHIALKLAGFKFSGEGRDIGGVNSTLGLPIIRTSVDHGTAFDIAGKGVASARSLLDAIDMAAAMARGKKRRSGNSG